MPKLLATSCVAALFSFLLISGARVRGADTTQATTSPPPSPQKLTAQQDHAKMMEQLGITSLRRGADGMNRQAPNYQNTDEAKANPWPNLPDPLVLRNGQKVTTPEGWWRQRRPEIVEDFDREVYGRVPKDVPPVNWEIVKTTEETIGETPVVTKQLLGHVDIAAYPPVKVDIQLTLTTPAKASGPVPVMMEFGFVFPGGSACSGPTGFSRRSAAHTATS